MSKEGSYCQENDKEKKLPGFSNPLYISDIRLDSSQRLIFAQGDFICQFDPFTFDLSIFASGYASC